MADRIAPETGYAFGSKTHYRNCVWNVFRRYCKPRTGESKALLMPSSEGLEIETALRKGFKEKNLYVVDRNPAIVATLKRKYPAVTALGVDVDRAAIRIADNGGSVQVANLDLCNKVGPSLFRTVYGFVVSGVIDRGMVAVTMLRGREHGDTNELLGGMSVEIRHAPIIGGQEASPWISVDDSVTREMDQKRLVLVYKCLQGCGFDSSGMPINRSWNAGPKYNVGMSRAGIYKSTAGNQTMMWCVYKVHRAPCVCDFCFSAFCDQIGSAPSKEAYRAYSRWMGDIYGFVPKPKSMLH